MAIDRVNIYSDALFNLYSRLNLPPEKGSQNGWPFCQTETGLRIFQEAAQPHISGTVPSAPSSSSPSPPTGLQSPPLWLRTFWPVYVGALIVICCVLALVWLAHKQARANARLQYQDTEIANTRRETAQHSVQSPLSEISVLNDNQPAFPTSQTQIGAGLAKLSIIDTQFAALVSTQGDATRGLAAAQIALAQDTSNLLVSLRQTLQQGLAEAAGQSRADAVKLQSEVADLLASLSQTLRRGLTEAASQSRTDAMKLQSQVAELAANLKGFLDRLSGSTNVPNLALALPGVRTKTSGNSILLTFDDGLFLHGTYFKPDAKSRLEVVAKALAQVCPPLRIEVIGCADDDRAFRSRTARFEESLALERASVVVDYFIALGLFAPKRLAALSSGSANRPFPSDTVQNRARNRTTVLRLSTDEKPFEGYDEPAL
jgi:flagellar motor protein MotB